MDQEVLYRLWLNDVGRWVLWCDVRDEPQLYEEDRAGGPKPEDAIAYAVVVSEFRKKMGLHPHQIWMVCVSSVDGTEIHRRRLGRKDGVDEPSIQFQ